MTLNISQNLRNAWHLYRDHLRWHTWDDVFLLIVLTVAPLFFVWLCQQRPSSSASKNPVSTTMVAVQPTLAPMPQWERTIRDGYVYVRRLGPRD